MRRSAYSVLGITGISMSAALLIASAATAMRLRIWWILAASGRGGPAGGGAGATCAPPPPACTCTALPAVPGLEPGAEGAMTPGVAGRAAAAAAAPPSCGVPRQLPISAAGRYLQRRPGMQWALVGSTRQPSRSTNAA